MKKLEVPQGSFCLSRYPERKNETLRAWDAADEYILKVLTEQFDSDIHDANILILNDAFGALSLALASQRQKADIPLTLISDSYLSQQGILHNLTENNIDVGSIQIKSSLDLYPGLEPKAGLGSNAGLEPKKADIALIKIPKSLAELEQQLYMVRACVGPETKIIAGGMTKTIHTSTLKLFEAILGKTTTSLAVKKARLIFVEKDEILEAPKNPFPKTYVLDTEITGVKTPAYIVNHGGVFSHAGLDRGTRFLLEHMEIPDSAHQILDLGCGSGVVGVIAALRNPGALVTFADESVAAIESARLTAVATLGTEQADQMEFRLTDCLEGIEEQSQDIVLNNPPFHQRGGQADHISHQMFVGARRVLKPGCMLWVVGNRHLGYHTKLKKVFGNCRLVAGNSKFVVLSARKEEKEGLT